MIKCKLSTLMGMRKKTIQDIHNETNISRNSLSNLYHEKTTRIDLGIIDRLCTYFNCPLSDLLEHIKDG